jgi:hydroxyacylglutathione hydrolase
MSKLEIRQIPLLTDNYSYLVREPETGSVAVVDPAEAEPVLDALRRLDWRLTHILNTHHHGDHVGGNRRLKDETGCTIVGPAYDRERIPGIDIEVSEESGYEFGHAHADIFFIPGHTRGHIAYWFAESRALFCGDTLFSLGCGRLFEGNPMQMWNSLGKIRRLPDDARVYCAHEYTESNARFALTVDPANEALQARMMEIRKLRAAGKPTVPSILGEEKAANPFLRADDPMLAANVGLAGADPVEVFGEVRRRKDNF